MGIGTSELIVIFVVALLVFGPRKIPEIARMIGKASKMFREASEEVRRTIEEDLRAEEYRQLVRDVKSEAALPRIDLTDDPAHYDSSGTTPSEHHDTDSEYESSHSPEDLSHDTSQIQPPTDPVG